MPYKDITHKYMSMQTCNREEPNQEDEMTTRLVPHRLALPPPVAALVRRAKIVLTAVAFVASILMVAVASWPFKVLVVLVFIRGLFASDVMAFRAAPRDRRWAMARERRAYGRSG